MEKTRNIKPETTNKYFVALEQIYQEHKNGNLNDKVLRQIIRKVSITLNIVLKTMGYIDYKNGSCEWLVEKPTQKDALKVHIYSLDYGKMNKTKKGISYCKVDVKKPIHTKREERKKQTAEIFTPPWLAQQMIDKIPIEYWQDANKTLLEPACGDGVFVELCLLKKIENIRPNENKFKRIYDSLKSVYAVDIMVDNINETRRKITDNIILKNLNESYENGEISIKEYNNYIIEFLSIILHNIKSTKDTLKINFDEWNDWDNEPKSKREDIRNYVRMEKGFSKYLL